MARKVTTYVIDTCALIAYFRKETGSSKFYTLMKNRRNKFFMHSVNVGEIYYDCLRISGKETADELFNDIAKLPISIIWTLDVPFLQLVGKYKTSFAISYADSFVLALSEREGGTVISTDHHEFDQVKDTGMLSFYWLR